jgi:formamidopyrimidine-DNA glycosylase
MPRGAAILFPIVTESVPELPEVETVVRGLRQHLEGATLTKVVVRRPDLRQPFPKGFVRRLTGRRVVSLSRRAKYIMALLDDGVQLLAHLGMSGRMVLHAGLPPSRGKHDHVVLITDADAHIVFSDPRRFGLMTLIEPGEAENHSLLCNIGPEPLGNAFDGPMLAERLRGKKTPLKAALLDQRVVAGLGNIYVCEALYMAGLSPRRQACTVGPARAARLVAAIREVLQAAIAAGGSSLRDYVGASGELGYFQHNFSVYDREGAPCPTCDCDGAIQRIVQSGRSTFYCPRRQR